MSPGFEKEASAKVVPIHEVQDKIDRLLYEQALVRNVDLPNIVQEIDWAKKEFRKDGKEDRAFQKDALASLERIELRLDVISGTQDRHSDGISKLGWLGFAIFAAVVFPYIVGFLK